MQVTEDKSVTLYIKYISPNGHLSCNSETSPIGYTRSETHDLNISTKSIDILGWGNANKCIYDIGENRIEIYVDEYLIHSKTFVVDSAPSEKFEIELKKAYEKWTEIYNTQYFKSELETLNVQMTNITEWQMFRSQSDRERQINEQQNKINSIKKKAEDDKAFDLSEQQSIINKIKFKLRYAKY